MKNFFNIPESSCGGLSVVLPHFLPAQLIVHAQAADILSNFQGEVLKVLQELADKFNNLAKHTEDVNQTAVRALVKSDRLKQSSSQKIGMAFQTFLEDLATAIGVEFDVIKDAVNGSPILSQQVASIIDFARVAKMTVDSSQKVIDGKSNELVIQLVNSNQAHTVNFNMNAC